METRTITKLAEITDEGLFERIATAVLRLNSAYEGLAHTGITADGKTRKSPVDGLVFTGEGGTRLILVHHTTAAAGALERKWLLDPASVRHHKRSKSGPPPPGDVVKALEIVRAERAAAPRLAATLILTTNQEPDEALIRKAVAAGRAEDVTIDVWPRSRLAARLDLDPRGQVIRRKLLGIEEELLSRELIAELSRRSVYSFRAGDDPRLRVERRLDARLGSRLGPVTFLVAGSGSGKTIAGHKALTTHIAAGGAALVISDATIESALTLEQAAMATLQQLHPTLALGQNPFAFFTEEDPLLILVEDVNRSAQPSRLVEKLAGWLPKASDGGSPAWRLLCPVWPHVLRGVRSQIADDVSAMALRPESMSHDEAASAVLKHARSDGTELPRDKAGAIAAELGDDPLLIALNRNWSTPRADEVIDRFIEESVARVAIESRLVPADLRGALLTLGSVLLRQRNYEPGWNDLLADGLPPAVLDAIRALAAGAEILWTEGPSSDTRLRFRHDRVRDWLLAEAALELDRDGKLDDDLLGDPALAEVMGAVLLRTEAQEALFSRALAHAPLALFHALRLAPTEGASTARLATAATDWLRRPENRGPAKATLRWQAMAALEGVVGNYVCGLVQAFPEESPMGMIAMLRNGDVRGGVALSSTFDLHPVVQWTKGPLEGMPPALRSAMVADLSKLLDADRSDGDTGNSQRWALIEFAGVLGSPNLVPALERMWTRDSDRESRLPVYLWALARCSTPETASKLLGPVCAFWAALPSTRDNGMPSPKDDLAAHSIRAAFEQAIPAGAIGYFVQRAQQPDLEWQIEYMLHGIDHPEALLLQVSRGAKRLEAKNDSYTFTNQAREHWRRVNDGSGEPMSPKSRTMLLALWQDRAETTERRKAAYDLWAAGREPGDLAILQAAEGDPLLAESVLRDRLQRGDTSAIPGLIAKLDRDRGLYWWFYARFVWSAALHDALDRALSREAAKPPADEDAQYGIGSTLTRVIMRLPVPDAEALLLRYWDRFGRTMHFVQAALYVATPELLAKADEVVRESTDPVALFKHFTRHFGIRVTDEAGITREQQIEALAPYLGHLRPEDLETLADVCNGNGWYELRRRLLDPLRAEGKIETPDFFRRRLDESLSKGHHGFIDHDLDNCLEAGVPWRELTARIKDWLATHDTKAALELAERAIRHAGERGDAALLSSWAGSDRAALQACIEDNDFALRRRNGRRR